MSVSRDLLVSWQYGEFDLSSYERAVTGSVLLGCPDFSPEAPKHLLERVWERSWSEI